MVDPKGKKGKKKKEKRGRTPASFGGPFGGGEEKKGCVLMRFGGKRRECSLDHKL